MKNDYKDQRSILNFHQAIEKNVDSREIKGFVSMNNADRSGDFVTPESFNIPRYMANPQVLVDHRFWKDAEGNSISVGKTTLATVARLANNPDNPEVWNVETLGGQLVDTFSKERIPEAFAGQRGLFARTKIFVDEVWEKVLSGELNSFSWMGMAALAKTVINGVERVFTRAIDLMEVSLVHIPDNFMATFEIAKAVKKGSDVCKNKIGEDQENWDVFDVVQLRFSTDYFDESSARDWLANFGFSGELQKDGEELVYTHQQTASQTHSLEWTNGIQVLVAYNKTAKNGSPSVDLGETLADLFSLQSQRSKGMDKEDKVTTETQDVVNDEVTEQIEKAAEESVEDAEVTEVEPQDTEDATEETEEAEKSVEEVEEEVKEEKTLDFETLVNQISAKTAEAVNAAMQPLIEQMVISIGEPLQKTAEAIQALQVQKEKETEKEVEKKAEEQVEETKAPESPNDRILELLKSITESVDEKLASVKEDVSKMKKSAVTPPTDRDEVDAPCQSEDPNAVFGDTWPFA